jgi:hypothetical protein
MGRHILYNVYNGQQDRTRLTTKWAFLGGGIPMAAFASERAWCIGVLFVQICIFGPHCVEVMIHEAVFVSALAT